MGTDSEFYSRALVLLSGGLDSSTALYFAKEQGHSLTALSFDYGQRHRVELERARRVADAAGVLEHVIIKLDPGVFSGTALVGKSIDVPSNRSIDDSIPVTYVPARNTLFLSYALALAESREIGNIYIGANILDYSGYPDCRPVFLEAFEKMAALGTKKGVEGQPFRIRAPLVQMTKAEIIREGLRMGLDYGLTLSCYNPADDGTPCGQCDSCQLRAKGFQEAGARDPAGIE